MGKYVDFTQGAVTGILAGLAQLNCSELTLKQLEFKQGVLGLDKLAALAATAWLADIRSSQLPALLGGFPPHFSCICHICHMISTRCGAHARSTAALGWSEGSDLASNRTVQVQQESGSFEIVFQTLSLPAGRTEG